MYHACDVKFISVDRQKLDFFKDVYLWYVNSIFVEIQPDSTNIKQSPSYKGIQFINFIIIIPFGIIIWNYLKENV